MSEEGQPKKRCFVVMGFGEKVDFEQQKTFDLDKTYRIIIKRAVEAAGFECIRADDVMHSGIIDKPMYELLLEADLVIADLSTSNPNAIYELGVRHALRPNTTIVIAEKNFKFPFDVKSLLIRQYHHLGSGIDAEEAEEFREKLTAAIQALVAKGEPDSPIYTFLPELKGPVRGEGVEPLTAVAETQAADDPTVGMLMEMVREARGAGDWTLAKSLLTKLHAMIPGDSFVVHQLALATYKQETDDPKGAYEEAREILRKLRPETSRNPETLGLWGAVHKRLWEFDGSDVEALEESIRSYGRGFYLKDDSYNGINYAFMLDHRASKSEGDEAIADRVWAERVRRRVIEICDEQLQTEVTDDAGRVDGEAMFWLRATRVEALLGTGQEAEAEEALEAAAEEAPEDWMEGSLRSQLDKLRELRS